MTMSTETVPGYIAGTWSIDPANSDISFTVRHLGVSKAHGRFNEVSGRIVTGESVEQSSVSATIVADSVDTGFPSRDTYIKGGDVLAVADHKELSFVSTNIRPAGDGYEIAGTLTIRGVTRPVTLSAEIGGITDDPTTGKKVLGASAITTIKRDDFGLAVGVPGMVVSDDINIRLDIYATLAG
jgi:polyisoprenoid-binding protein YceI